MFKKIPPKFKPAGGSASPCKVSVQTVENGVMYTNIVEKSPEDAYPDLPHPDNFSLDKQLSAGIPLTEVNSKILTSTELSSQDIENLENTLFNPQTSEE